MTSSADQTRQLICNSDRNSLYSMTKLLVKIYTKMFWSSFLNLFNLSSYSRREYIKKRDMKKRECVKTKMRKIFEKELRKEKKKIIKFLREQYLRGESRLCAGIELGPYEDHIYAWMHEIFPESFNGKGSYDPYHKEFNGKGSYDPYHKDTYSYYRIVPVSIKSWEAWEDPERLL